MAKRLDAILVIDVEATCWEGEPPPGQSSEIIEIGLCVLDVATLERREQRSILVRPEQSTISPFCTALTTLTQAQVEQGVPLRTACEILKDEYKARQRLWASYGDYDRGQFEAECQRKDLPYPFGRGHLNVKTLFAITHALPREVGMAQALARLELPLEGTHHRGGDDAWNIAAVLAALLRGYRR
ncbi:MAG: exonuclease domain-containing protein [Anaerolineae bacterium]|nr:exonuclease domain-containing protein [Anaerolineae bacterium]